MIKPRNIKALETGSGISWEEWIKILAPQKDLNHTQLAKYALEKIQERNNSKSPEWWAQGVAVAYEQFIGRRKVGQTCDGNFSVTLSKTLAYDMDKSLNLWMERIHNIKEFNGVKISRQPKASSTEKWRYWRCGLEDKSSISVNIQTKSNLSRSVLSINHDKIQQSENLENWRKFWRDFLNRFD